MIGPTSLREPQSFFESKLSRDVAPTDTTIYLEELPTVTNGYLVIDQDTAREETIVYTGINSIAGAVTGCIRGLSAVGHSEAAGTGQRHGSGAIVAMNVSHYYVSMLQYGFNQHELNLAHSYRGFVATSSDLASIVTPTDGDTAFVLDIAAYFYYQSGWNVVPGGGGSGGGGGPTINSVNSAGKPMTFSLGGLGATVYPINGYQDQEALVYTDNGTNIYIQDPNGFTQSRDISIDLPGTTKINGYAIIAKTLYLAVSDSSNATTILKFDATNLSTGGTVLLLSGGSFGTTNLPKMTSDGINLYFNYNGGNSANDYVIAGYAITVVTLNYISSITCGSTAGYFGSRFGVSSNGSYFGLSDSTKLIKQYDGTGTLQYTSGQFLPLTSDSRVINWGSTFYINAAVPGTDDNIFVKIYLPQSDLGAYNGSTIAGNANENLTKGQTVGVAPFIGGFARANRKYTSLSSFPSTPERNMFGTLLIEWIGDDRIFVLYKVNGSNSLAGVVGTVSRDTMTVSWGTPHTYVSGGLASPTVNGLATPQFALIKFTTDKVGVLWVDTGSTKNIIIDITTFSGATITPSGNQAFASLANDVNNLSAVGLTATTAAVFTGEASTYNPRYRAFSISGTTLGTVGTAVTAGVSSGNSNHKMIALSSSLFVMGFVAGGGNNNQLQAASVSGTTISAVGAVVGLPSASFIGYGSSFLTAISATKFAVAYDHASGNSTALDIGTVSGVTITLSGTPTDYQTGNFSVGVGKLDANTVLVNAGGNWTVIDVSGAIPVIKYSVNGSGDVVFVADSFVIMNGYFAIFQFLDYSSGPYGVVNKAFIEGMSFSFTGFAEITANRNRQTIVLTDGQDSNQTGLNNAQFYDPDGSGGLTPGSLMQATSPTTILKS